MTLVKQLLMIASRFAAARKLSVARVSTLCFGDGKLLTRLADESDLTTGRFERAMQWFSDRWPEGADWPDEVPRPAPPPDRAPGLASGAATLLPAVPEAPSSLEAAE